MGQASRKKWAQRLEASQSPPPPQEEAAGRSVGRTRTLILLSLIAVLALLAYSNTFSVPFQFDDEGNIIKQPMIESLAHFRRLGGTRHLGFLTFALNYAVGGFDVFGYHLVNLLIHIANGFLVYGLALLLTKLVRPSPDSFPWIPLTAALLFVAHPVQTQAVTYIVQRFASLVTLFYLASVAAYLKWRLSEDRFRWTWYVLSLVSCVLAMKTKENSFTIPFMILLIESVFFRPFTKKTWLALIPFLLTLLIIPVTLGWAPGDAQFARDATAEIGRWDYLVTQFRVIVTYLRLLVLPIGLNLDYDYPVYRSLWTPPVFFSFLFLSLLVGASVYLLRRAGLARLAAFGVLWFFLTLSIESSFVPIKDMIFEHRLYLPLVGFALSAACLAAKPRFVAGFRAVTVLIACILCILAVLAYQRNLVWKDKITLWRDVAAKSPQKPRAHYNLGLAYQEKGLFDAAIPSYQKTLELKPDYADAYNNIGNIHKERKRFDEAVAAYQKALEVSPDHAEVRNNLANVLTIQGRPDSIAEAIRLYEEAVDLKPDYAEAYSNLGIAYTVQGRFDEAIAIFRKALALQDDLDQTYFNLGNTYMKKGDPAAAIAEYGAAAKRKPGVPDYHYALGNAYLEAGRPEEAIRSYETTVRMRPDFAAAHFALGNAYVGRDRRNEALLAYERAVKARPDFAEAYNNLGNIHLIEGRFEEAVREYRKALTLKPDYAEAARNLAVASKKQGTTP